MTHIFILNGPNLNMLGRREPEIYGSQTLDDIKGLCLDKAQNLGFTIDFRQTNHEGTLVDWVQEAFMSGASGVILNAAAYTHTSVALHDALKLLHVPVIEVHISDPKTREAFRHHSYVEPVAAALIAGQGAQGYVMALEKMGALLAAR